MDTIETINKKVYRAMIIFGFFILFIGVGVYGSVSRSAQRGGIGFMVIGIVIIMIGALYLVLSDETKIKGPTVHNHNGIEGVISKQSSLDILKTRYARGEINKEEFEQIKRDIEE